MGARQSCHMCTDESAKSKKEVVVMKEDGEAIKFKQGTRVKDVLEAYPYHKIIRCCSDRTVLAASFQLNANWFYFLLPEGLSVNDTTYQSLMRAALEGNLLVSRAGTPAGGFSFNGQTVECANQRIMAGNNDEVEKGNLNWEPNLSTIHEANSPSLNSASL